MYNPYLPIHLSQQHPISPSDSSITPDTNLPEVIPLPAQTLTSLPHWIHHNAKITFKLPDSPTYQKGILIKNTDDLYKISIGRTRKHATAIPITSTNLLQLYNSNSLLRGHNHLIRTLNPKPPSPNTSDSDPSLQRPLLPTEHKPMSSDSSETSFTIDQLRKAFGFRNIDTILSKIQQTCESNFTISTKDKEPIIDLGDVVTIPKSKRNTLPLPLPPHFGDTMHMDIVYGTATAINGIRYGLFIVDRATRMRFILPIKNLKNDLLPTLKTFCNNIGMTPKRFITDFDHKLMGQQVLEYFTNADGSCIIESAPPNKQSQNGLAEANWKSILYMARAWLSSSLLPSKFWWFAMKRATEISNYLPIRINNQYSTPLELAYGLKPNLKNLFPMFSVAYITRFRDGNITRKNVHSHSIRAILVGRDPFSNACLFYHPGTQRTITSDEFVIDETLCAGPAFHLEYDGGLYFNKYSDHSDTIRPPLFTPDQTVFSTTTTPALQGKILTIPSSPTNRIYTIQLLDGSIHQILKHDLSPIDPALSIDNNNPPTSNFFSWIKNITKATMLLPNTTKPVRGYLIHTNNQWIFRYGNKTSNSSHPLPDFYTNAHTLIQSLKLFEGHPKDKTINRLRQQHNLSNIIAKFIAKHVSARNLTSEQVPTLIQHKFLNANDKRIWDDAYAEEYQGLLDLPC